MKVNALRIAGLTGSLILASAASADFSGIFVQTKTAPAPFTVYNLWACFTSSTDKLLSVTEATYGLVGGASFFQHALGGPTAPLDPFITIDPTVAHDTFVTIGKKSTAIGADGTTLEPGAGFSGPGGAFVGGYFNSDPDNGQGNPITLAGAPTGFYVLIAQLSFQGPLNPFSQGSAGGMIVAWKTATSGTLFSDATYTTIPAPGALALLGIAGLAGRRRRA